VAPPVPPPISNTLAPGSFTAIEFYHLPKVLQCPIFQLGHFLVVPVQEPILHHQFQGSDFTSDDVCKLMPHPAS
jgi:hypothetical protein